MASETWAPKWAPHASGTYERAIAPDGSPEPTWVELKCAECGEAHRAKCESGMPREWILRWARVHLHRDPLGTKKE